MVVVTKKAAGLKQQILFGLKPSDVVMLVLITSQDGLVFGQNIMWTGYECWAESEYMVIEVLNNLMSVVNSGYHKVPSQKVVAAARLASEKMLRFMQDSRAIKDASWASTGIADRLLTGLVSTHQMMHVRLRLQSITAGDWFTWFSIQACSKLVASLQQLAPILQKLAAACSKLAAYLF
ncbi:hypothetical protein Tco_0620333 [Tanacetum coccineum]